MASSPFLTTSSTSVWWRTVSSGLTWSVITFVRIETFINNVSQLQAFFPKSVQSINLNKNMIEEQLFSVFQIFSDLNTYFLFVQKEIIETLYEVIESEFNCIARKLEIIIKCWRASPYAHWISAIIEFSAWRLRFLW